MQAGLTAMKPIGYMSPIGDNTFGASSVSSPSPIPPAERIEALQRKRTRLTYFQGVMFLLWQANFLVLDDKVTPAREAVSGVKVASYIVWALLLLAFLATGGNWWVSREVRAILNDETTRAHRHRALMLGFWAAMIAAIGCYVVTLFEPLATQGVIHIVLTAGIFVALIAFGVLERRAQADG